MSLNAALRAPMTPLRTLEPLKPLESLKPLRTLETLETLEAFKTLETLLAFINPVIIKKQALAREERRPAVFI